MVRFLLLIFLLSNIALANGELKESEISQRTGHELDSYERGYFRLFNDVSGYRSADFFIDVDSNTVVKINFTKGHIKPDSTFTIKKEIAKQIKFYIENYELLNTEEYSGYKFDSQVWTYIKPSTRYYKNYIKWHDLNSVQHVSTLLYVDSMFFVVQVNSEDYNWRQINDSVTIVNFNQVLAISSHLVERNANKFWNNVKELKGSCSFINHYKDDYTYPKELVDFTNEKRRIYSVKIQEEPQALTRIKLIDGNLFVSKRIFGFQVGYPMFFSNTSLSIETISDRG